MGAGWTSGIQINDGNGDIVRICTDYNDSDGGERLSFMFYADSEGINLNFIGRDGEFSEIYSTSYGWNLGKDSYPFNTVYCNYLGSSSTGVKNIYLKAPNCSQYITMAAPTISSHTETALVPSSNNCCHIGTSSQYFWYGYFGNLYAKTAFNAPSETITNSTITNLTVDNLTVTNVNGAAYTTSGGSSGGSTEVQLFYCQIIASVAGRQTGGYVSASLSYNEAIPIGTSPSNNSFVCRLYRAIPSVQNGTSSAPSSLSVSSYSKGAEVTSGTWKIRHPLSHSFSGTHDDNYAQTNGSYSPNYQTYYAYVIILASK